jgi:hypothetical protein
MLQRFLELGWLCRSARGRAVTLTEGGYAGLSEWIGLDRSQLSDRGPPEPRRGGSGGSTVH